MAHILLPPDWQARELDVTPEHVYRSRRQFIRDLGLGTIALSTVTGLAACTSDESRGAERTASPENPLATIPADAPREGYPATRNARYTVPERAVSERLPASSYNNFYEFRNTGDLKTLWHLTGDYDPFPRKLEVSGLVEKPLTLDIADVIRSMELEERLYRFRCVEAWSMTVPWTGFPLRALIERCKPLSKATHVRFVSAYEPEVMPGIQQSLSWNYYDWPYYEGLRMDEAMNELAFVATGMYGEPLPKQNGSPWRMVLPWKYGYKGAKAFVKLEFVDRQPGTFWNTLEPREYGFFSNVNPNNPHPRWSQATEEILGTGDRVPTKLFNGYEEWVGQLYPDEPKKPVRPTPI